MRPGGEGKGEEKVRRCSRERSRAYVDRTERRGTEYM